jgi:hypothetical protein
MRARSTRQRLTPASTAELATLSRALDGICHQELPGRISSGLLIGCEPGSLGSRPKRCGVLVHAGSADRRGADVCGLPHRR